MEDVTEIGDERIEITITMLGFRKKLLSTILDESFVTNLKHKIMSSKNEDIETSSKVPLVKVCVKDDKTLQKEFNDKWNK